MYELSIVCRIKLTDEPLCIEITGIKLYDNIFVSNINSIDLIVDTAYR